MRKWAVSMLIGFVAAAMCACVARTSDRSPSSGGDGVPEPSSASSAPVTSAPPELEEAPAGRVRILAAGDNLIHDALYNQARRRTGGTGYDFRPVYAHVQETVRAADLALINQETMMDPQREPSNYPQFNSPPELAMQLQEVGFDVLGLANNHMLDVGLDGLLRTLGQIDAVPGLARMGAFCTAEEREAFPVYEVEGIRVAFLSFTQFTNVGGLSGYGEHVAYLGDEALVTAQMSAARERADAVVVSVHYGPEGAFEPDAYQRAVVRKLCDLGADVVFGHHSHVLQPAEFLECADGRRALVFYSLGNFVSAQHEPQNLVGLMPTVTLSLDARGTLIVGDPVVLPVVTHYNRNVGEVRLYPVGSYTEQLAASHGVHEFGGPFSLPVIQKLIDGAVPLDWQVERTTE